MVLPPWVDDMCRNLTVLGVGAGVEAEGRVFVELR
jgi:hypothetical protein